VGAGAANRVLVLWDLRRNEPAAQIVLIGSLR
jgi:hypothetical protein